jgi:hypothetical protein
MLSLEEEAGDAKMEPCHAFLWTMNEKKCIKHLLFLLLVGEKNVEECQLSAYFGHMPKKQPMMEKRAYSHSVGPNRRGQRGCPWVCIPD